MLDIAESLNRLGEASVKNGTGKVFGHNHQQEFTTQFEVDGETKTAWEIIVENTDPRYVTFQLDTFWAADAGATSRASRSTGTASSCSTSRTAT
ncbi:hypothetical protein [Georgenia sp. SUBG003]|uniref:hypothetical protein n=1 Tax=Georgenia sp. SUBG003 TaxID=1497974 RepID=UPI003AB576D0